jgi:hypothetical protein
MCGGTEVGHGTEVPFRDGANGHNRSFVTPHCGKAEFEENHYRQNATAELVTSQTNESV